MDKVIIQCAPTGSWAKKDKCPAIPLTPKEIAASIKKYLPEFKVSYKPDFRQEIADSWPQTIDDSFARKHWGWEYDFDLDTMTADMLKNLKTVYGK